MIAVTVYVYVTRAMPPAMCAVNDVIGSGLPYRVFAWSTRLENPASVSIFWQRADSSDHAAFPFPLRYASEYACTAPRKASVSDIAWPATVGTGAGLAVSDAAVADGVDVPVVVDPVGVDDEHPAIASTATATTAALNFALTMSLR